MSDLFSLEESAAVYFATKQQCQLGEYVHFSRQEVVDGQPRYFHRIIGPLPMLNGNMGVFGIYIDVTEQRQAEMSLRDSERRYATLAEVSPIGIFRFDAEGQCVYLNPRWSEIAGRPIAASLGDRWQAALHPDDRDALLQNWATAFKQQQKFRSEGRFKHPDGRVVWFDVQVMPEFTDQGKLVGYVGTVSDITSRKEAELALQQLNGELEERVHQRTADLARSEQDLRTIFNNVYDAIFIQNFDGVILDVNDRALELNGATRDQLIGATVDQISAPSAPVEQLPELFRQIHAGATLNFEWPAKRLDTQTYFDAEVSIRAVKLGNQTVSLACVRDISDRKQAEKELRAERLRLQLALAAADMGTWSCSLNPACLQWSARTQTIFGFAPGAFGGDRDVFLERVHPEDRDRVAAAVAQTFATGVPYKLEYRIYRLDGALRWIAVWGLLAPQAPEEVQHLIGVVADITDRKQAEENLRSSEERFRQIAENIDDVFWLATADQSPLYVSPTFQKVWGRSPEGLTYASFLDTLHPDDRVKVTARSLTSHLADPQGPPPEHDEVEYRILRPDGEVRWISDRAFPVYDEAGQLQRIAGVAKDITQRKQLEQEQARLLAILEASPDHIGIATPDAAIIWNNRQAKRIRGLPLDVEVTSIPMRHYHPHWALQKIMEQGLPAARRDGIWIGETALLDAEDNEIPVSQLILAHTNAAGELAYFSTLMRDISEIKQAEQALRQINAELESRVAERTAELREAKDAAEAANRAKSVFLANMSHELRTPLNAILGFSQLMARDLALSPEHLEELQIISRSGEHLLELINDILEMSKIEAGRITLEPVHFSLQQLLDNLTQMLRLKAEAKDITFTVCCDPDVPAYICTDSLKLRQILLNLLSNAIKFTAAGSVTLRVRRVPSAADASDNTLDLCFAVEDTGCGIDPQEFDLLFVPFGQTASGRQSQEGTGLGLPISREFVKLLGGDLMVQSQPGQGSCFTVVLPVQVVQAFNLVDLQDPPQVTALAPGQPEYRILVVEDDWPSRVLLQNFLTDLGFAVATADDGYAAIQQWASWRPHLIFMDVRMPGIDGLTATRQIREREQIERAIASDADATDVPTTCIIALTAGMLTSQYAAAIHVGCNAIAHKPIQTDEIAQLLVEHLGVIYEYAATPHLSAAMPLTLAPQDLQTLPLSWLREFYEALLSLHQEKMFDLIRALPPPHQILAPPLTQQVQDFHYEWLILHIEQLLGPPP